MEERRWSNHAGHRYCLRMHQASKSGFRRSVSWCEKEGISSLFVCSKPCLNHEGQDETTLLLLIAQIQLWLLGLRLLQRTTAAEAFTWRMAAKCCLQEIRRQLEQLAGESGGKFTSEDVGPGLSSWLCIVMFRQLSWSRGLGALFEHGQASPKSSCCIVGGGV